VQPEELPSWAEQNAAALLADLGDRWRHVQAVAAQARQVSAAVAPEDRPYLVAAAWLHDVGYASSLNRLGFHPVEAEERGLVEELAEFAPEDGPVLDALTYADMTTGPAGQRVVLDERIAEILDRYPPDDPVHRANRRSRPALQGAIGRTLARLGAAADQPM
jgi:hypothetical protein